MVCSIRQRAGLMLLRMFALTVLVVVGSSSFAVAADTPAELAKKARAILEQKCHACHGDGGSADGKLNYILDRNRLVKRRIIVAGRAVDSVLFRQVKTGTMPKGDEPLSKAELDTLRKWIDGGAVDFNPPVKPRAFITNEAVLGFIQSDLQRQAQADAEKLPFLR